MQSASLFPTAGETLLVIIGSFWRETLDDNVPRSRWLLAPFDGDGVVASLLGIVWRERGV